jgi:transposase
MADLGRRTRITGVARDKVAREMINHYGKGRSIRDLARTYGRSYGFVRDLLTESGVTLRARGGPRIPARPSGQPQRASRNAATKVTLPLSVGHHL